MKTCFNGQGQKENISDLLTINGKDLGHESEELQSGIRALRDSLHGAAERPEGFWARQRAAICENLQHPVPASHFKPVLLWAPASIIVFVCLFLFTGNSKLPAPDFAVGADQNLLVGVERALDRDCPEALAPAATLVQEIR